MDEPANDASNRNHANPVIDGAARLRSEAGARLRDLADEGRAKAGATLDGLAQAAQEFAERLGEASPVAGYAKSTAQTLGDFAENMRGKSLDELVADSRAIVRKSPALAVGVALVAGFALSRFLKAGGDDATPARLPRRDDA